MQLSAKATSSVAPRENPPAALSASAELQSLSCSNFPTEFTARDQEDLSAKGESQTTKTGSTSTIALSNRQLNVSDKLKILIVDDSPAIVKMTSMMLKKLGHDISSAENGEVAIKSVLKKLQTAGEAFDVILMDLQMPVMDGLEATKCIRGLEKDMVQPQVIVGMSANSDHETKQAAISIGMDTFVAKPFNMQQFQEILQSHGLFSMV